LINNAGIVNGKPLLDLPIEAIEHNFGVNLLSHFYTLKAFLPGMVRTGHGTVVTISSVLGQTGAAYLTDYTAAKAGLTAMHKSLVAELRAYPEIKTLLVKPGQLSTPLFEGVDVGPIRGFFGPVIEPVEVAKEVIKAIDGGSSGELAMPFYARWIDWMNVMPVGLQTIARWASGVDVAMKGFKGRREVDEKESLI
jgi:NAD(P)-dependent dehydrogenase (short-subunit alcohol dehydrogenase family)